MTDLYAKTAAYYERQKMIQLRKLLRREYGPGCYRINSKDEVHALGKMPNTQQRGWYFVGYLREVARHYNV